jgi:23S rRNA (cytidine1920-2'-O)/16S rRNA (cytidine1409-2'-O)-methyltransferase
MKERVRIDRLLVETGLAESREKAQAMVMAGEVLADGQKVTKAGQKLSPDAEIRLLGERLKYVSRGGLKLEAALHAFAIQVQGKVCLDIGSSTGGFTDCLLQQGAKKVYAVDVGTAQLHWNLRQDARVVLHENVNARYLSKEVVPEEVDFACCDVSFISATRILPALPPLLKLGAALVVLVKPQFEVGKGEVGKGGIVRDPRQHREAVEKVRAALAEIGFSRVEEMESPILGAEGNKEFLLYASQRVSLS